MPSPHPVSTQTAPLEHHLQVRGIIPYWPETSDTVRYMTIDTLAVHDSIDQPCTPRKYSKSTRIYSVSQSEKYLIWKLSPTLPSCLCGLRMRANLVLLLLGAYTKYISPGAKSSICCPRDSRQRTRRVHDRGQLCNVSMKYGCVAFRQQHFTQHVLLPPNRIVA